MSEDALLYHIVEALLPFLRHALYDLVKASQDTQLTLEKAALEMGVNRATLKKRCQRGNFPYTKVGDTYYISKMDVNLYIKGGMEELRKYNKEFKPK